MRIIIRKRTNGVLCEEYHGPIPDSYRTKNFGPITDIELPDAKVKDDEFTFWIRRYREMAENPLLINAILELSKCN